MNLFDKPKGVRTSWFSFENQTDERGRAGLANGGAKGHAFDSLKAGETRSLLAVEGSGTVTRIWITIGDRSREMLRSLRIEMFWDGSDQPAVSVPFGDFFGCGLGRVVPFECALFSSPEGRSFNCFVPMPFRSGARISITNTSDKDLIHLFYDVDLLLGVEHTPETLYFHATWRREAPNTLGQDFDILPKVSGNGRFLGCNVGVIVDPAYDGAWWGEGEVKVRFGDDEHPTLCGSGTEDYIGTGWGQGTYSHRTQGCLVGDKETGSWAFYRYHLDDPVYFDGGCRLSIQTIGGDGIEKVIGLLERGVPVSPVSVDTAELDAFVGIATEPDPVAKLREMYAKRQDGWCNFWREDDWSATAYFYLDSPDGQVSA